MSWNDTVGWILSGVGVLWFVGFGTAWVVKRDADMAFLLFFSALFLPISMAFFSIDNERPTDPNLIKIDQCIADGGDPEYTTNRYGQIVYYFGCVGEVSK